MDKNGDAYIPLLDLEEPDALVVRDFITQIYNDVVRKFRRTPENGIYEADLWYDMIETTRVGSEQPYWWVAADHPYVDMILSNDYEPAVEVQGRLGSLMAFEASVMRLCIEGIVKLCHEHDLKIRAE